MRFSFIRSRGAGGVVAGFGLMAGCSIHPLPEDVAPLNTVEIVEHIRCEMYEALRAQVALAFRLSASPEAVLVADEIEAHPERTLKTFESKRSLLKDVYRKRLDAFGSTEIGYGFKFNITEQNVGKGEVLFTLPWNPATNLTLKAGGGIDKKRANTRRFFKVENFKDLALSSDCLDRTLNAPNLVYPITGTIGLRNVVDDFVKLTTRGAKTSGDSKEVKNFSEQLSFTTEISGSINPKVKLAALTDSLKLTDASFEASGKRTDLHELTVTFAVPSDVDLTGRFAVAPEERKAAVIKELNKLQFLNAVEQGGVLLPQSE